MGKIHLYDVDIHLNIFYFATGIFFYRKKIRYDLKFLNKYKKKFFCILKFGKCVPTLGIFISARN